MTNQAGPQPTPPLKGAAETTEFTDHLRIGSRVVLQADSPHGRPVARVSVLPPGETDWRSEQARHWTIAAGDSVAFTVPPESEPNGVRLEFFDGAGAPVRDRDWTPRDGVVMVPRDADQLRITLGDSREGAAHAQLEAPEASSGSRYVIREATLIIDQTLTEPQLRDLEARLGIDRQPRQFRPDAGEFQFPLEIPASGDPFDHPAVVYARVHELAHRVETYATL
jgi:hypothetical protein